MAGHELRVGVRDRDDRLAEVGVAVEWGSLALREAADITLKGAGPSAVAAYVANLAGRRRLPTPPFARRRLRLGYTEDGREFSLAVRGRNVLIAGDAKSGKSWVAGLLCEQLILHGYCVCVIDPEGDYGNLDCISFGRPDQQPAIEQVPAADSVIGRILAAQVSAGGTQAHPQNLVLVDQRRTDLRPLRGVKKPHLVSVGHSQKPAIGAKSRMV
mgnify:CR=1 FL=1